MAGSGPTDRGKEAIGMLALHETLRNLCINSDWTYSVFWTIRPRPYSPHFLVILQIKMIIGPSFCSLKMNSTLFNFQATSWW